MKKRIGVLGGGQLAMMLREASLKLGFDLVCYEKAKGTSASHVAKVTVGDYFDEKRLTQFVESCNVVTFETENIPLQTIEFLKIYGAVHPHAEIIKLAQDRILEKEFVTKLSIPTTPFENITTDEGVFELPERFRFPAILKTRTGGYDGKGQIHVSSKSELISAWHVLDRFPAILESKVNFKKEYSLIAARNIHGETIFYPIVENFHHQGIIRLTKAFPRECQAELEKNIETKAQSYLSKIMEELNYVGILTVEFFLTENDTLLFNEMAPRVHNSGHFSIDGCSESQFENHLRAICGMDLTTPQILRPTIMVNWVGDTLYQKVGILEKLKKHEFQYFDYDYQKTILPNRKLGHTNFVFDSPEAAQDFFNSEKKKIQ